MFEYVESFRAHDRVVDLRKVLAKTNFPLFVLPSSTVDFHLESVNLTAASFQNQSPQLTTVTFGYFSPNFANRVRSITISNSQLPTNREAILALLIRHARQCLPKKFAPPFDWSNLSKIWSDERSSSGPPLVYHFLQQLVWEEINASDMPFQTFHSEDPGPFALAYHYSDIGLAAICSLGTPHIEFVAILDSLIDLQQGAEQAIDALQGELRASSKETIE